MTTMYAIPALVTWDSSTAGGWSNSSGGASNGTWPTSSDPVVFDANSGASRTITVTSANCGGITTVGANAMTFASGGVIAYGNIDLTGTVSSAGITSQGASATIKAPGVPLGFLHVHGAGVSMLLSDITTPSSTTLAFSGSLNMNGFSLTGGAFQLSSSCTLTIGTGTFTLSGGGGGNVCNVGSGETVSNATGGLIKFTDTTSSTKTFIGAGKTFGNVEIATGGNSGVFAITGANTFSTLTIGPGAVVTLPVSTTNTVSSLVANGTGGLITLRSSSAGTAATLAKSGGGTSYVDYCSIKDITASPSSTFFARSSVNVSGNTNWTFILDDSNFLSFF